jgi:plasmid stabilization system protein ParE
MHQIIWSPRSRQDYIELMEYLIDKWGLQSAKKVNAHLMAQLDRISQKPELYQRSGKHQDIRRCVLSRQTSLYYRVQGDRIELITLIDNRKHPKRKRL